MIITQNARERERERERERKREGNNKRERETINNFYNFPQQKIAKWLVDQANFAT